MDSKKKIVVIGGGTGTYSILSGLKKYTDHVSLTAVVAMSDNGSSTGRLRDEFGALPVGDVRMALLALADEERIDNASLRRLLSYRFLKGGDGLAGHNFGNLLLVALSEVLGSTGAAIDMVSRMLGTLGTVLPVSVEQLTLVATYDDGVEIKGESSIDEPPRDRAQHAITGLRVLPSGTATDQVTQAIAAADLIVLGPGDLYTSVLAAVVVGDMRQQLQKSHGKIVFVTNLMSKFGQTTGYDSARYTEVIEEYVGRRPDAVIINTAPLPTDLLPRYHDADEFPVVDTGSYRSDTDIIRGDFLAMQAVKTTEGDTIRRSLIRHDAEKIAPAILDYLGISER